MKKTVLPLSFETPPDTAVRRELYDHVCRYEVGMLKVPYGISTPCGCCCCCHHHRMASPSGSLPWPRRLLVSWYPCAVEGPGEASISAGLVTPRRTFDRETSSQQSQPARTSPRISGRYMLLCGTDIKHCVKFQPSPPPPLHDPYINENKNKTISYGAGNSKFLKLKLGGFRVSGERLHPSKNLSYGTLETEN